MNHNTVLSTEKAQAEFLALVDKLTDEQKAALYVILKALTAENEDKGGAQ